jgi:hypothetical protein
MYRRKEKRRGRLLKVVVRKDEILSLIVCARCCSLRCLSDTLVYPDRPNVHSNLWPTVVNGKETRKAKKHLGYGVRIIEVVIQLSAIRQ